MDTTSPRRAPENLESWLRYYEDLGISSFYRDRASLTAAPSAATTLGAEESMLKAEAVCTGTALAPPAAPQRSAPVPEYRQSEHRKVAHRKSEYPKSALPKVMWREFNRQRMVRRYLRLPSGSKATRSSASPVILAIASAASCIRHRNKIVFGVGNPHAELVFVGEGPGHDEDLQGIPFVGRAGQLLTQMIVAMGLCREDVYIANVVKCRPPENRTPEKDEVSTCMPFLLRQIAAIEPKVIVCLGNVAAQSMLGTNKGISNYRGQWLEFRGARLMATYHPAYLLRNPNAKPEVWADLKKVMAVLGLKMPRPAIPLAR